MLLPIPFQYSLMRGSFVVITYHLGGNRNLFLHFAEWKKRRVTKNDLGYINETSEVEKMTKFLVQKHQS